MFVVQSFTGGGKFRRWRMARKETGTPENRAIEAFYLIFSWVQYTIQYPNAHPASTMAELQNGTPDLGYVALIGLAFAETHYTNHTRHLSPWEARSLMPASAGRRARGLARLRRRQGLLELVRGDELRHEVALQHEADLRVGGREHQPRHACHVETRKNIFFGP